MSECVGDAGYDRRERAEYIAASLAAEAGGRWIVVRCGEHWHAREDWEDTA